MTDRYAVLKWFYCQRFGLNPVTTKVTRDELLKEHVFRTLELEGKFLPSRIDYILSLSTFLLEFLACPQFDERIKLEEDLLSGGLRMKKQDHQKKEDSYEQKNKMTELFFSSLMAVYGPRSQQDQSSKTEL